MADGEYGDEGYAAGDYFYDDEWLYIEDEVAFADELAETQIPSPGYSGVNAELMLEWYEYDTYEYFGELEYGSDEYWDVQARKSAHAEAVPVQRGLNKRRRASTSTSVHTDKRRKLQSHPEHDFQNVVWRENKPQMPVVEVVTDDSPSYALLPDWKERFSEKDAITWQHAMPDEMQRAAEAVDETELEEQKPSRQASDHDMNAEAGEAADSPLALDPEAIRDILRTKLGNTGMDETAFMAVISQMLSDGGTSDEAAAQLTAALLGGGDSGSSTSEATLGWLAGQGVAIGDTEADEGDVKADETEPHTTSTTANRPQRAAKRNRKR